MLPMYGLWNGEELAGGDSGCDGRERRKKTSED